LSGGGDRPPPPWRIVKDKAYLRSLVGDWGPLATWIVTLILKGAKVPGPCQPSATRTKRSVRPLLYWEWEWETDLPCRDKEEQSSSSVHSGYIVDRVLAAGEVKGSVLPNVSFGCTWSRPLEVCIVVWPISKLEEVASGQTSRAGPFTGLKPRLSY
jgi:hypothetical protein